MHNLVQRAVLASMALVACAAWGLDAVNQDRRGVALAGYDPVAYFHDGRPVRGNEAFSSQWTDASWHFASEEHRAMFDASPAQFAPQYGGYCAKAVSEGTAISGDPQVWRIVEGELYLFQSREALASWEQDVTGRTARADAHWPRLLAAD